MHAYLFVNCQPKNYNLLYHFSRRKSFKPQNSNGFVLSSFSYIGNCKVMFFDILDVVSIYENELKTNPFEFWGLKDLRLKK